MALRFPWDGPVAPAYRAVEVPEKTKARNAVAHTSLRLVGCIEADAEKGGAGVIKALAVGLHCLQCGASIRIGSGGKETQDDVATCGSVKGVARIAVRTLVEPRRRIAGLKRRIDQRRCRGVSVHIRSPED